MIEKVYKQIKELFNLENFKSISIDDSAIILVVEDFERLYEFVKRYKFVNKNVLILNKNKKVVVFFYRDDLIEGYRISLAWEISQDISC